MKVITMQLALILFLISLCSKSNACSAFSLNNKSQTFMCKSYDWGFGEGVLMFNPRGIEKKSMPVSEPHKRIHWITKYANLSFNQYGQTLPNGGINEKGLAIEILWLKNSNYGNVNGNKALNELQWIQYGLDSFASVNELIEKTVDIKIKPMYASVHYYISDALGNSAVIEYINGKRIVSTGNKMLYSAITNSTYENSVIGFQTKPNNGYNRFNTICMCINKLPESLPNNAVKKYGFETLDKVKTNRTQWQIVYDLKKQVIYFKTQNNLATKSIDLNSFDFNSLKTLYADLSSPAPISHTNFKEVDYNTNKWLINNAFNKLRLPVSDTDKKVLIEYITYGKINESIYRIINDFARFRRK